MTPLASHLVQRIRAGGPITVAEYMAECLLHPQYGYYITHDPLGASGDFTTAPEISQMFGELIGLALAQSWLDRSAPSAIYLVELGPGRGTLMADILRATSKVPGFHEALDVRLVEASPVLRERQTQVISRKITHHDRLDQIPDDAPIFLVANEFFDALPIRQFQRQGPGWRERVIGISDNGLTFGLTDPTAPNALEHRLSDTTDGDIVEINTQTEAISGQIAERIAGSGGLALIIDYGDWRSRGDTLQAVRQHQMVPVLDMPGTADLTAHVDFEAIARSAGTGVSVSELAPQGEFLERLGITQRARTLAKALDGEPLDQHIAAHRRLTHPKEMGTIFKVMALYQKQTPLPPGFST